MNRMLYFAPIASFPLMALAQQSADDSLKTDNPFVAAALILIVCLAVSVGIAGYFRFQKRGLVVIGIIFSILDWLITAPICVSAGVNVYASAGIATVSAVLIAVIMIRYGRNLISFLRGQRAERFDTDED